MKIYTIGVWNRDQSFPEAANTKAYTSIESGRKALINIYCNHVQKEVSSIDPNTFFEDEQDGYWFSKGDGEQDNMYYMEGFDVEE